MLQKLDKKKQGRREKKEGAGLGKDDERVALVNVFFAI